MKEPFTITEFAKIKGCSRQTINTQIKKGRIVTAMQLGKNVIPRTKDNLAWEPGKGWGRPKKENK